MSTGKRILWIGLLLTVVAALWPLQDRDVADGVAPRSRADRNLTAAANAPAAQLRSLARPSPAAQGEIVELFPRQSWTPPPAANAAPDQPVAPPLPFTYGGGYTEGNNIFAFLIEGVKMHTVRQGDTVNGTYRVDNIAPGEIALTYLPLGLRQNLQTGSTTPK